MWFMILADDAPGNAAIRQAQRPAHLAYLQALVDHNRLLLAGPRPLEAGKPLSETPILGSLPMKLPKFVGSLPKVSIGLPKRVGSLTRTPSSLPWS